MAYILHNHITLMKIGEVTCSTRKCFVIHSDPDDFSQFSSTTFEVFTANNTPTGLTKCGYKRSNQQLLCWLLLLWSPGHDLCFHASFKVEIISYFRGSTVLQVIFPCFLLPVWEKAFKTFLSTLYFRYSAISCPYPQDIPLQNITSQIRKALKEV